MLSSDKTLHQAIIDFNSAEQDPWWLMDQIVVDKPHLQNIHENVDAFARIVSNAAIGVFSPFETQHLSDMSMTFPLLVIPETFSSIAMKVKGAWSDPSMVKLKPKQCPEIGKTGLVTNVATPYWYDTVEHEQIEDAEEDETADSAVDAQSNLKGTSQREYRRKRTRTSQEQPAVTVSPIYRSRRVRCLYDHAICESVSRAYVRHMFISTLSTVLSSTSQR